MKLRFRLFRDIRKWELAVALGLVFAVITAIYAQNQQHNLASGLIRLHVIANSDDSRDQYLKLQVRDKILQLTSSKLESGDDVASARVKLENAIPEIEREAKAELLRHNSDLNVNAVIENVWFPTRDYEGFSLPAGNYEALRVVIGKGSGKNWWCVVFPPLCLGAVSGEAPDCTPAYGLSDEQVRIISDDEPEYKLKFKVIELFGELQSFFDPG